MLSPLDTSGEKPYEEFVGEGECACEIQMRNLRAVSYVAAPPGAVAVLLAELERLIVDADAPISKSAIAALLAAVVPQFRHVETGKSLDQRM
jgi:hypothetical protein